jgi:capsular polysaccharide biosynthesis protein
VKYILSLFTAVLLLAVGGCVSSRSASPRARLVVESASSERLSPSSTSSALKAHAQVATAKVISRAQDPRFQAEVADELGLSPETVGKVVAQGMADTHLVELRADIADPLLAANIINAVARKLAEDFKHDPDVQVRVVDTASPPSPVE